MNIHDNETKNTIRELMAHTSSNGHNPFKVPNGYFDTLTNRVMQRINAEGAHTAQKSNTRLFFRLAAAAMLAGAFFMAGLAIYERSTPLTSNADDIIFAQELEYTDELLDYAMLDNSDIEYYLTAAE